MSANVAAIGVPMETAVIASSKVLRRTSYPAAPAVGDHETSTCEQLVRSVAVTPVGEEGALIRDPWTTGALGEKPHDRVWARTK